MSKGLIERLREQVLSYDEWAQEKYLEAEAADRIEELERELSEAKDQIEYAILRDDAWKKITEKLERELAAERKRRASSYKLLVSSMEKQKDIHLAERIKFRESLATLDSERAANERLTQERDALLADNERLREALRWRDVSVDGLPTKAQEILFIRDGKALYGAFIGGVFWYSNKQCAALYWKPMPEAQEALAATPAQSLARIRNQVREEIAQLSDSFSYMNGNGFAGAIRAMKEPE